jgi:hypothetical protein
MMDDKKSDLYPGFTTRSSIRGRVFRFETGAQRLQRGQIRPTNGAFARLPSSALTTKNNGSQALNLSNSRIRKIGGVSVSGNTSGFAYTATTTSITWYWDGSNGSMVPIIRRADGTSFRVPISGSGLTVTGLTINTTYYFLPFWNTNNLCNIGWVPGTAGSPQIAFVVADTVDPVNSPIYGMEQTLQGNEALTNGFMTAATTAAGTGGGGAGGGGAGGSGCVMSGTDIETVGGLSYTNQILPESHWVHLRTESHELYCTYDHPLYHALKGQVPAESLVAGDLVITDQGEQELVSVGFCARQCSKYKITMDKGHLFWSNGFLSHNKVALR